MSPACTAAAPRPSAQPQIPAEHPALPRPKREETSLALSGAVGEPPSRCAGRVSPAFHLPLQASYSKKSSLLTPPICVSSVPTWTAAWVLTPSLPSHWDCNNLTCIYWLSTVCPIFSRGWDLPLKIKYACPPDTCIPGGRAMCNTCV